MPDLQVLQNLTLLDNIWISVCIQHQATDKGVVAYMQLPRNILWKLAQNKRNSINSVLASSSSLRRTTRRESWEGKARLLNSANNANHKFGASFDFNLAKGKSFCLVLCSLISVPTTSFLAGFINCVFIFFFWSVKSSRIFEYLL